MEEYDIDKYYLPLTTTKKRLIAVFILQGTETESEIESMVGTIVGSLRNCGWYPEALKYGYANMEDVLNIFIEEPVFDVYNHLNAC